VSTLAQHANAVGYNDRIMKNQDLFRTKLRGRLPASGYGPKEVDRVADAYIATAIAGGDTLSYDEEIIKNLVELKVIGSNRDPECTSSSIRRVMRELPQ
jgi:hypothetical protein